MNATGSTSTLPLGSSSSRPSTSTQGVTDLWADILKSADRGGRSRNSSLKRKNVSSLSERHRGRTFLLQQLAAARRTGPGPSNAGKASGVSPTLAMGYEVLRMASEDGEEDSIPPSSVFYPPNSHPSSLKLVDCAIPPHSLPDTAVVILLDWSRPAVMIRELSGWFKWVEEWAGSSEGERGQREEMRERLQSHIQHYTEPASPTSSGSSSNPSLPPAGPSSTTYAGGPLLPLGPGSSTLNHAGVPIVVVCSRADSMDATGDELGMKGQWEERTDWVQQVLRTICLAYGAALFYTAPTQPQTYTFSREYLSHRLYTTPPPSHPTDHFTPPPTSPFPFARRANVLDRDAVMVPAGWDSHGKINVSRDRFDPSRVSKAWERSCAGAVDGEGEEEQGETVEDLWTEMIPDTSRPVPSHAASTETTVEPEQTFSQRQSEHLQKDPNRDPRASFRTAAAAVSAASASAASASNTGSNGTTGADGSVVSPVGVVGPMGAGGLNSPGVEKVMAEMEGGSAEEMKEKFARLGRRETGRTPTTTGDHARSAGVPNEALHNFFQGSLANKGKSAGVAPAKTPAPAAKE